MQKKPGILRRNKGVKEESWDLINGNDNAFFQKEFPDEIPRIRIDSTDYGRVVIPEGIDPGETMGKIEIGPTGSDAQDDEKDRQGHENTFDIPSLPQPHSYYCKGKRDSRQEKITEQSKSEALGVGCKQ